MGMRLQAARVLVMGIVSHCALKPQLAIRLLAAALPWSIAMVWHILTVNVGR